MVLDPNVLWLILFLPLAASALILLFALNRPKAAGYISCGAVIWAFVFSLLVFFTDEGGARVIGADISWLSVGGLNVSFGLTLDPLSKLMLLIVTGVGSAIHVYSIGYMHDDPSVGRFFAKMSLFTFSMLGIVLASNFIQLFIFWELVGVSSYLLIGFWYERASAAEAAKKAFMVNRIGDFGFMLGILMFWAWRHTLDFQAALIFSLKLPAIIGLLIFCGAVGKSAQFPLHVWLPDAMEGPTPVSALIHAATMVAAGVYMLCRVLLYMSFSPDAMAIIAWVGGITALMSALIGCVQNDIKRILAYSTLSQLGYMVMAVGLAGTGQAMFHLTTHAFFKALLFLSAGSVIVAFHHHEQNIWNMGGLRKRMKLTTLFITVGALAMSGVLPLSGFWSKDEILALAAQKSEALFAVALLTAGLTAFYIWRLVFVAFCGAPRSEAAEHAKESPPVMTMPLALLAIFSVIGGFMTVPHYLEKGELSFAAPHADVMLVGWSFGIALLGFGIAWVFYGKTAAATEPLQRLVPRVHRALIGKFYFDQFYDWLVANVQQTLADIGDWFDRWIIAGLGVRGITLGARLGGWMVSRLQTGNLGTYAFVFAMGLLVILYFVLIR